MVGSLEWSGVERSGGCGLDRQTQPPCQHVGVAGLLGKTQPDRRLSGLRLRRIGFFDPAGPAGPARQALPGMPDQ